MHSLLRQVEPILQEMDCAGFPTYLVGGCVRDGLMGRTIHDFDMATAALPDQVKAVFPHLRALDTGLKHGTITLLTELGSVEITTFRTETTYSDHRRPDAVYFTTSLEDDLSRRDFTMNAMALGLDGLHDPFGGQQDIQRRVIRCVGDPETRFREDALRMLRGLRFASALGFQIDPDTAAAIHSCKSLLHHVSIERVTSELLQLLCGNYAEDILLDYADVMTSIIPELAPSVGFDQHTHYHSFDVYTHIVKTVMGTPPSPALRLAALLHDVAKPETFRLDEDGVGHFFRHAAIGAPIAEDILRRFKLPNQTIQQVVPLVKFHGLTRDTPLEQLPKLIAKLGEQNFFNLLALDRADSGAKHPYSDAQDASWDVIEQSARHYLSETPCLAVKDLEISGIDAQTVGLMGREIGVALNQILDDVLGGKLKNSREDLLVALSEYKNRM